MKLTILFTLLLITLLGCQSTGKYGAPLVEDCINLAKYDASTGDTTFRCFCTDLSLTKKTFPNLVAKVRRNMSNHPKAEDMLWYLEDNKKSIIKKKEYVMYGYYCRGYSATSARNRELLENWAEENRVKRIKCEKGRKTAE